MPISCYIRIWHIDSIAAKVHNIFGISEYSFSKYSARISTISIY